MNSTKLFKMFLLLGLILVMVVSTGCGNDNNNNNDDTGDDDIQTETETVDTGEDGNIPPVAEGHLYEESPLFDECSKPGNYLITGITLTDPDMLLNGYVEEQIVFTGIPDDIDFIVDTFSVSEDSFESPFMPGEALATIELPPVGEDSLVLDIRLHELKSGYKVWEIVGLINEYSALENQFVFVEPNYIIGDCPGCSGGIGGDPCPGCSGGIGGDPCPGCSGGIGGDPGQTPNIALENAKKEFLNQWAFDGSNGHDSDIGLYDQTYNWTANSGTGINYTGKNIEIAVFDTVPSNFMEGDKKIDWASVPFDLCVWKPGLMIQAADHSEPKLHDENFHIQEHGLFVTGLAQGVAPEARYFLIEALNADAQGDVISLLFGMNEYATDRRKRNNENLNNTVINLSLGLGLKGNPTPTIGQAGNQSILENLQVVLDSEYWVSGVDPFDHPYPKIALMLSLKAYENDGAMIVAAAGNDSNNQTQDPAKFPKVLGVSSNNFESSLSSFSNYGDVAAPGGDGVGNEVCTLDLVTLCADYIGHIGDCPYAIMSLISINPVDSTEDDPVPGFGYWAGTSMSTPMVSGLAALVFDKCPDLPPKEVRDMIETAAFLPSPTSSGLGAGIINVENTLALGCQNSE